MPHSERLISAFDGIVVGGGAAGMMCAIEAGKRGRKILILDHAPKPGAKILISGGGRCNFTNTGVSDENYFSDNPHFCKSALSRFTPQDFMTLVEKHHIAYHEKKLGQLFCDGSARQILDLLLQECREAKVVFQPGTRVSSVQKNENGFLISTNHGAYQTTSLVIATGGLSLPKTGATDFGYEVARQFGLNIISTSPALDGFVFSAEDQKNFKDLAGVSLDVRVTCNKTSFRENILFTHLGLSGPAALQASLYWKEGDFILIDLLPELDPGVWFGQKRKSNPKAMVKNLLSEFFPQSFAECFSRIFLSASVRMADLSKEQILNFSNQLKEWKIFPKSTVGYSKAEVTRGGVDTNELSSQTLESKKVSGLYFIGEVVDVTGWLGGYNFQWAWASGWVAGQYV